jgi:hypothetical protein
MDGVKMSMPQGISPGDYAAALDRVKDDPGVKMLQQDIVTVQDQMSDIDRLMKLPREERLQQVPNRYYPEIIESMQQEFVHQKDLAFKTLLAGGLLATVATIGAAACGAIPMFAATALGSMMPAISFGSGLGYLKAAKKWTIPRKADRQLQTELKNEMSQLEARKTRLEGQKEEMISKALKKSIQDIGQNRSGKDVVVEDDFVDVAGIRLKKNAEPTHDCMKYVREYLR